MDKRTTFMRINKKILNKQIIPLTKEEFEEQKKNYK